MEGLLKAEIAHRGGPWVLLRDRAPPQCLGIRLPGLRGQPLHLLGHSDSLCASVRVKWGCKHLPQGLLGTLNE